KAIAEGRLDWVQSPNDRPLGDAGAARATTHGGFDDDPATVAALVATVLGKRRSGARVGLHASAETRAQRRRRFTAGLAD
ncbi:hypothetical protein, partial [Klebsiella pneumoniae]